MKKYIIKSLSGILQSKMVLSVAGCFILMSCGTQMGGYSETDGVYYDPNRDTLPEGVVLDNRGNQVGEYYDYADAQYFEDVRDRDWQKNSKYWDDNATSSDWGAYAGSETNFYQDSWGWGMPYGYYSPFYGHGFRVGMSWGWGSNWGWYDPFWGYSPFSYYGMYGGYYPYGGWNSPYYGYYSPYYYAPSYRYQRSGANGRMYNSYQGSQGLLKQGANNGFRNQGSSSLRNMNQQPVNSSPRFRNPSQRPNMQQQNQPRTIPRNRPNLNNQQNAPRSIEPRSRSNDSGGFRSGGFNSGNSSSSGGGFRSGGTVRSGGR